MQIVFRIKSQVSLDALNNPVYENVDQPVDDVLIGPMTEPLTAREQQALSQTRDQVRVHIPKAYTGDLGNSEFDYDGKTFRVDSSAVRFMDGNTPGRWNRYFRAEAVRANA